MPAKNELKYEDSRTFRQHLRELCLRGLPRTMYRSPKAFDKILSMAQKWLHTYLYSTGYRTGTRHFFSLDGRDFDDNPFAVCMKTKEFKTTQLILHLAILSLLNTENYIPINRLIVGTPDDMRWKRHGEGEAALAAAIFAPRERTVNDFHLPDSEIDIDPKLLRETFNHYVNLGLLETRRNGKRDEYRIRKEVFALEQLKDYLSFWAGLSPIELVGSILKDRCIRQFGDIEESPFRFKFRYFHHILDAELLEKIFEGIRGHHPIVVQMACKPEANVCPPVLPEHFELKMMGKVAGHTTTLIPLKLYVSVHTGRRYLLGLYRDSFEFACLRLDRIEQVALESDNNGHLVQLSDQAYQETVTLFSEIAAHLWGVSYHRHQAQLIHVSFEIRDPRPHAPKVRRLAKERRCGTVIEIAPDHARFDADVYDGRELFPWIRTYIGYLSNLSFSDLALTALFWQQLIEMRNKYVLPL